MAMKFFESIVHGFLDEGLEFAGVGETDGLEVALKGTGGLSLDGAEVEQGWNKAFDNVLDVLQSLEAKDADVAVEEVNLVDEDDAPVGDDPEVEVVVGPDGEASQEGDEKPTGGSKGNEIKVLLWVEFNWKVWDIWQDCKHGQKEERH